MSYETRVFAGSSLPVEKQLSFVSFGRHAVRPTRAAAVWRRTHLTSSVRQGERGHGQRPRPRGQFRSGPVFAVLHGGWVFAWKWNRKKKKNSKLKLRFHTEIVSNRIPVWANCGRIALEMRVHGFESSISIERF